MCDRKKIQVENPKSGIPNSNKRDLEFVFWNLKFKYWFYFLAVFFVAFDRGFF
jgi:hypothetical protein